MIKDSLWAENLNINSYYGIADNQNLDEITKYLTNKP
jgi:hypothetical protein